MDTSKAWMSDDLKQELLRSWAMNFLNGALHAETEEERRVRSQYFVAYWKAAHDLNQHSC